jgi:hypothetical protein
MPSSRASRAGRGAYPATLQADILVARVLELPPAQQLRVHDVLEEVLGEERLGVQTQRSKEVRARAEALEAMRRAAAHLGLPEDRAPSAEEYKRAAQEADLGVTFKAAYAAFDRRWGLARDFYEGMPVPLTAAQRRVMRTRRSQRMDPVACLRLWWAETSPPRDAPAVDYEEWAAERNERKAETGQKRVLESTDSLCRRLKVSWAQAVALAASEKTLGEAQRDTKEARLRESGPVMTRTTVNDLLGLRGQVLEDDFPNPVACLERQPLWRTEDVIAYREGKRGFTHPEEAERGEYVDAGTVAWRLGIGEEWLRRLLKDAPTEACTRDARIPVPAGTLQLGRGKKRLYWRSADVEGMVEALRRRRSVRRSVWAE